MVTIELVLQMGPSRYLGVSFGLALVFLLPGLIFVKAVKRGERKIEDMTRLDKLAYAFAGTWASLTPIFGIHYLRGGQSVRLVDVPTGPVAIFLLFVGFQSVVAASLGYGWGSFLNHRRSEMKTKTWEDREQPWKYIADKIRQEQVKIITRNGNEIHGVVARYGSGKDTGDLTLGSPRFIHRSGGEENHSYSLGNEAFISKFDIAQIHYKDEEYIVDDTMEVEGVDGAGEEEDSIDEDRSEKGKSQTGWRWFL